MPKPPPTWRSLPHACLGLSLLVTLGIADRQADAAPVNLIETVTLVRTPHYANSYEIRLYSSNGFPMEDTSPSLNVGSKTFLISRYGPGDSLDVLIFSLTPSQFLSLHNGDPVSVTYSPDPTGPAASQYGFGSFSTPLLPKAVASVAPRASGSSPARKEKSS